MRVKQPLEVVDDNGVTSHLEGYALEGLLWPGSGVQLYTATRERDGREVLIHVIPREREAESRAAREREMFESIGSSGCLEVLDLVVGADRIGLVSERVSGLPIEHYARNHVPGSEDFLVLALSLARTFREIHEAGVLTGPISASQIMIDPLDRRVRIWNLSNAHYLGDPAPLDTLGTIALDACAPEHTERLGMPVGPWSDLYSLGCVLYLLATGRGVFSGPAADVLRKVLSERPAPAHEINPTLPVMLAKLIGKLLEKNPRARYSCARMLELDLIEFRAQLGQYGSIDESFVLGAGDTPIGPDAALDGDTGTRRRSEDSSAELSERQASVAEVQSSLRATRARVLGGAKALTVLSGPTDSGKCTLGNRVVREPESLHCRVLRSVFPTASAGLPHHGIRLALRSLLRQLRIEQRSLMVLEDPTLDGLAGAITQWMPEFEEILQVGSAPTPQLRGTRARNRLSSALESLVRQLPSEETPLIWMLEHIDRADPETLFLLAALLRNDSMQRVWVVATCDTLTESSELPENVHHLIEEMSHLDVPAEILRIGRRTPEVAAATAGTPQDVCPRTYFDGLDASAVSMFADAAICGPSFSNRSLGVLGYDRASITPHLISAIKHNVIEVCADGLRFVRPEAMASALTTHSTESANAAHLKLATTPGLWNSANSGESEAMLAPKRDTLAARIEDIWRAWHLIHAADVLAAAELASALDVVRASADLAMSLGGTTQAALLAVGGSKIYLRSRDLGETARGDADRLHRNGFALASLSVEAGLGLGWHSSVYEPGLELCKEIHAHRPESADPVLLELLELWVTRRKSGLSEYVHKVLAAAERLGIRESARPRRTRLRLLRRRIGRLLAEADPASFEHRAEDEPAGLEPVDLLDRALPLISWTSPALGFCLAARRIRLSLQHGSVRSPGEALAIFAHCSNVLFQDYAASARVAQLAMQVDARWPSELRSPRTELGAQLLAIAWVSQRRRILDPLVRIAEAASKLGDVNAAAVAYLGEAITAFVCGEHLGGVDRRLRQIHSRLRRMNHPLQRLVERCQFEVSILIDPSAQSSASPGDSSPEAPAGGESALERSIVQTFKLVSRYFDGRTADLYEEAVSIDFHHSATPVLLPHVSERLLFTGVLAGATMPEASYGVRRKTSRQLSYCERQISMLAASGPDNFEHQSLLLQAEVARTQDLVGSAMGLYGRAADRAHAQGYKNHAAVALERRANLALEIGLVAEGAGLLHEAIVMLHEWGARGAARRVLDRNQSLLAVYPRLLLSETSRQESREPSVIRTTTTTTSITQSSRGTLDLATVLRSSEAISGEVELDRVIERVLAITIENGSAQRGVLLLEYEGELLLEAERDAASVAKRHQPPVGLSNAGSMVPTNLVQYVQRTRRSVVLNDAASEGLFVDDPYVVSRRVRSILCLPIRRQGRLVGVLYLENASVSDAFNSSRVEVLHMLSSHAAISLDNARLYNELTHLNRDLEARIEERTEKLREARDAAEAATQAKSEFLAVMSHEIRTPMNVVIGMAQIMMDLNLTTDQKDCVRAIHTAGDSLLNVINDILDFSKIEVGKLELEHVPFALRSCLEDVSEILAPKAFDKGLEFPVLVDRRVSDDLVGDSNRLKQVIINFVNNAIKFTEEGSVSIRVSPLESATDRVRLRFEVQDTGIGIPKDRLDRLFQSFSQVDASTTRKYGGTGLGLVISKRLVEGMGGLVGVDSVEGEGSTFWFEAVFGLRDAQAKQQVGPTELVPPAADHVEQLAQVRALIVSRARSASEALVEQIAYLGASAECALSVEEAGALLRAAEERSQPHHLVILRYPLEDESFGDWMEEQRTNPERSLCLVPTLRERSALTREPEDVEWLVRPIKQNHLRRILLSSVGVYLTEGDAQQAQPSEQVRAVRSHMRILVAEDYALNRKMAALMLERAGYGFDMVADGRQTLEALAADHYDLVLMDCQMPEVDGFTAAREIRRRETFSKRHIPIVAMTANAMKGDRERCLEAGMDDYLSKPIQMEALYAVLAHFLPDDPAPASGSSGEEIPGSDVSPEAESESSEVD